MSLDGFMLICPRGHDEVTLWGQEALDHIQTCHGRKPGTVYRPSYGGGRAAHIWRPCDQVVKARPWKAPRAPQEVPAAFLEKLSEYPTALPSSVPWAFVTVTHKYVTDDERAA